MFGNESLKGFFALENVYGALVWEILWVDSYGLVLGLGFFFHM